MITNEFLDQMQEIKAHKLLIRFQISVKIVIMKLRSKFVKIFEVWVHHAWISDDLSIVES